MRTPTPRRRRIAAVTTAAALGLSLAACGDGDSDGGDGGSGEGDTITLGYIPSWTDGLSTAYLLEHVLEEAGYTVEHEEISEAGVLYTALAEGDVDMYPSAWPEVTHASYMEQYGDRIEDIGAYYDSAVLTLAVPEYSEITSIAELPEYADELGGRIVGIEPGAGLTEATQESVFPAYGLEEAGYSLATSSTATMLTELGNAIDRQEEIVVTLWRPFWANAEYNVRDLEDPEGALGEPEALHFLGREGFAEDFPEVAEWIEGIQLSDEEYGALEDLVVNEHGDDPAAGVAAWMEEHADVVGTPAS
ncbi:glycine betaine ABC transporter substrate-binding protein [Streptomyces marincola]|uniref:Glycine/betaine ABC transporter substrate-binding protein n=1 Tax=Streptomyces marincola TaxID=2878388 RepID=A0A1W7D3J5_9ACTN|nr:glycine betaine ABC transporter substrate-binding protein [Streptomyces marincola]ARQ71507.1 glycine/betaine ABC transporter substrate-binding protein [Streptomyces marincola]